MGIPFAVPPARIFSKRFWTSSTESLDKKAVRLPSVHVFVWILATLFALMTANECHSVLYPPSLFYGVVLWGWWGMIASVTWSAGRKRASFSPFSPQMAMVHLVVGPIVAYLHLIALWSLVFILPTVTRARLLHSEWLRLVNLNRFGIELLTYGFIVGVIGALQYHLRAQRDALRQAELERQLSTAQLHALQMQLEPHFLFNTLNAITTLVDLGRQEQASRMLSHLNSILQTTLARARPQKVPVAQELEMVENYLAIEQVRFADRLQIEIHVDHGALGCLVPSFLLQPIVENAIRHGISSCEDNGVIETSIKREGAVLHLKVRDTGSGALAPNHQGNGIGLKNTRARLQHFYQDRFAMKAAAHECGGFEVAISIPYEQ
jgi:sensor histidine kinase YesM